MQGWQKAGLGLAVVLLGLVLPLLLSSIRVVPYNQIGFPYSAVSNRFSAGEAVFNSQTVLLSPAARVVRLPAEQQLANLTAVPVRAHTRDGRACQVKLEAYYNFTIGSGEQFRQFFNTYHADYQAYFEQALRGAVFALALGSPQAALAATLSDPQRFQGLLPERFTLNYLFVI